MKKKLILLLGIILFVVGIAFGMDHFASHADKATASGCTQSCTNSGACTAHLNK